MTVVEQALNIDQNWTAEQARNDLERLLLRGERPALKVVAMAVKALEKQIPKRAIPIRANRGNDKRIISYKCPNCDNDCLGNNEYHFNCCEDCGQAIDWGETEKGGVEE
jgi:hypothetical protein